MGLGVGLGVPIRVENYLGQPFTIPQIHENHTAMIAPALNPAHQNHFQAHVLRCQLIAIMGFAHIA
jgi:hypothetical protein